MPTISKRKLQRRLRTRKLILHNERIVKVTLQFEIKKAESLSKNAYMLMEVGADVLPSSPVYRTEKTHVLNIFG